MLKAIKDRAARDSLAVMGVAAPEPGELEPEVASVVLLGPSDPGFWPHVQAAPEFNDAQTDPLDRWSARVIGEMARDLGGRALFPFGGPPYRPFQRWALASGEAFQSPIGFLVHHKAGLLVSYRGAIAFESAIAPGARAANPCDSCAGRPCLTTCPVGAFTEGAYDLAACRGHLDSAQGAACMTGGCLARRACPVSKAYPRSLEQSAFHMRAFHRT